MSNYDPNTFIAIVKLPSFKPEIKQGDADMEKGDADMEKANTNLGDCTANSHLC